MFNLGFSDKFSDKGGGACQYDSGDGLEDKGQGDELTLPDLQEQRLTIIMKI